MSEKGFGNIEKTLVVFIATIFCAFSWFYFGQVGDDSYIYFRYVETALQGNFGQWTSQLPPVEGYSSTLWFFWLLLLSAIGLPLVLAAKFSGVFFSAITVFLTYKLAVAMQLSSRLALFTCLLLVLMCGFYFWSASGLETSMVSALYVACTLAAVAKKHWLLPLALLGLARPEGPIILPCYLLCLWFVYRGEISKKYLVLALVPLLVLIVWRLHFYGLLLPNTFYAKAMGVFFEQVYRGLFYVLPVLFLWLASWLAGFKLWANNQKLLILLGSISLLLGLVIAGGGDWMFHWRLLQPVLPLFLVLLVYLLWQGNMLLKVFIAIAALPMLIMLLPVQHVGLLAQGKSLPVSHYQEGYLTPASIELADKIRRRWPAPQLIAVNHAGALPFALSEYQFIDMVGLNDPHIAHVQGDLHAKFDMQYVLAQKPDLIILNTRTKPGTDGRYYHKGYWQGEDALVELAEFKQYYQPAGLEVSWSWRFFMPYSWFAEGYDSWVVVYQRVQR